MASNYFGNLFRFTTFGESHGPLVGAVIDGCPALLPLTSEDINRELAYRRPGFSPYTSPRLEKDEVEIVSGVFEGQTTGAPICLLIRNTDAQSSAYEKTKELYRPGHAQFAYLEKYGIFDHRGGGRASARETAARVAVGAVAKKLLSHYSIDCLAYVAEIGDISAEVDRSDLLLLRQQIYSSPLFCPDRQATEEMQKFLEKIKEEGDSIGGIVAGCAQLPSGLGEPLYCKLEALLASAMLSLPASKGFEIGCGFAGVRLKGSQHNDVFTVGKDKKVVPATHCSGGTLGGISNGSPLFFRVAFKPASSIKKPQQTVNGKGEEALFQMQEGFRHDPCVAIRAVPVVEAMTACVLADLVLLNRNARID